jgi:hypothetical protein
MLPRQPLRFVLADDPGAGLRRAPNGLRPPRGDGCPLVGDKPSGQAGAGGVASRGPVARDRGLVDWDAIEDRTRKITMTAQPAPRAASKLCVQQYEYRERANSPRDGCRGGIGGRSKPIPDTLQGSRFRALRECAPCVLRKSARKVQG